MSLQSRDGFTHLPWSYTVSNLSRGRIDGSRLTTIGNRIITFCIASRLALLFDDFTLISGVAAACLVPIIVELPDSWLPAAGLDLLYKTGRPIFCFSPVCARVCLRVPNVTIFFKRLYSCQIKVPC